MENETIILGYLEAVLGKGKNTARNNFSFFCPNGCHPTKHKLEVNLDTNQFNCWICGGEKNGYKGKNIYSLLKQANAPKSILNEIKPLSTKKSSSYNHIDIIQPKLDEKIQLPDEYKSLYITDKPTLIERHALVYLRQRDITQDDIIKYNIGYCATGKYKNRIIIPLYDKLGQLNYFEARSFDDSSLHYLKPNVTRDIIPNEYLINWNLPIILCEGAFDMIAIKRNAIPLLGKNIQTELMKRLVTNQVKKVYIAIDKDAIIKALQFCETLIQADKEVYLVEMTDKDPSQLGHELFTELTQTIQPLTYSGLLKYKLNKL